ncbi:MULTISPECIES: glutathione-disulfide reductase [Cyanophyceae]|uniref:glutathione-disulfide reductase n=1 Tax=Cyanophyceae TaxID=3028117 RepID=UPI00168581E2|nr:glutathione-disulfide reductase [Trichocoleus sp. FACHB-69]MBD1934033.1 glutathione-disulfide reductase [Trichocoleus sp. FACHB-69]
MKFDYDLLVIGAGPGGLAASERAAGYGARVAIAEQDSVGGTCVIRGCIPEKLMSFAAEFSDDSQVAAGYGWNQAESAFDWQQFIAAKEREIHRLSQVHNQKLEKAGVALIKGKAAFIDAHTLEVAGRKITADKILIAVGAKDVKPEIPGSENTITSSQLFSLKQQPKHIAVIGGNYIPVKLAGILNNLGCQVTQVFLEDHILSAFEEDIALAVQEGMTKRGIQILENTAVKEIKRVGDELDLILSGKNANTLSVDTVLFALCRTPNNSGLDLEKAGIQLQRGAIVVDEYNRTTQANIFAVGDCINRINFTPVAIAQGRAFADTQFGNNPRTVCYEYVPSTVSSQPQAATVGFSEAEAREKLGDSVRCYCSKFRPLLHSLTNRDEKTLIKLVVDSRSDRVLGAHMVGEGAIEIIQCLALALRVGATKKHFDETIGIHPSIAEEFLTLR